MAHIVTCIYCKKKFDRDKFPFIQVSQRRYAHQECSLTEDQKKDKEEQDKIDLENYIMKLLKVDYIDVRVRKQIKQREDAIALYAQAGRTEQVEKEQAEITILAALLPKEMTEAEIMPLLEAVIAELGATSKKDMGRVMKEMQARTEGRAPGKILSQLVGSRLN